MTKPSYEERQRYDFSTVSIPAGYIGCTKCGAIVRGETDCLCSVRESLARVRGLLQRYRLKSEDAKVVRVDSIKDWRDCAVSDWSTHHPLAKLTHDYYAEAFRNGWGESLAPITLYVTAKGEHELEDGFHRLSAAIATGQEYINAQFIEEVGAESADIGKLDSADKKCAYCKHTHTFQFDDIVDDDCPVVGCPCMHFLGSAETGGEKAAPQKEHEVSDSWSWIHIDEGGMKWVLHDEASKRVSEPEQEVADRDGIIRGLQDIMNGDQGTALKSIKKRLKAQLAASTFPRSSQNQTLSSGVEGAHEGTTADEKAELPREHQCVSANDCPLCDEYVPPKSGSREPGKLNNAPDPLDYFLVTYGFDGNNHARQMLISCWAAARQYERKQVAESSLSSPRD